MNNKTLGIIGLLGAPFLLIGYLLEYLYPHLADSWFTGFWGLIYMAGWTCSIIGLQRMEATGAGRRGKAILWIVHFTIVVANVSNVIQLVTPKKKPEWFFYIDLFWPLSNTLMLVVGITCLFAKKLKGKRPFIPLLVGLWLPLSLPLWNLYGGAAVLIFSGLYSFISWSLLAFLILGSIPEKNTRENISRDEVVFAA